VTWRTRPDHYKTKSYSYKSSFNLGSLELSAKISNVGSRDFEKGRSKGFRASLLACGGVEVATGRAAKQGSRRTLNLQSSFPTTQKSWARELQRDLQRDLRRDFYLVLLELAGI
jgi:hypothetical protein